MIRVEYMAYAGISALYRSYLKFNIKLHFSLRKLHSQYTDVIQSLFYSGDYVLTLTSCYLNIGNN